MLTAGWRGNVKVKEVGVDLLLSPPPMKNILRCMKLYKNSVRATPSLGKLKQSDVCSFASCTIMNE